MSLNIVLYSNVLKTVDSHNSKAHKNGFPELTEKTSSVGVGKGKTGTIGANSSEGGDQMSMVTNS